jgi:hypothetical protein
MEEQKQDSHCENRDSADNSDVVDTNHSRPLPSHKEAHLCVCVCARVCVCVCARVCVCACVCVN